MEGLRPVQPPHQLSGPRRAPQVDRSGCWTGSATNSIDRNPLQRHRVTVAEPAGERSLLCGADHRLLWSAAFGSAGRRQKPIVCPTERPLSEQYWAQAASLDILHSNRLQQERLEVHQISIGILRRPDTNRILARFGNLDIDIGTA